MVSPRSWCTVDAIAASPHCDGGSAQHDGGAVGSARQHRQKGLAGRSGFRRRELPVRARMGTKALVFETADGRFASSRHAEASGRRSRRSRASAASPAARRPPTSALVLAAVSVKRVFASWPVSERAGVMRRRKSYPVLVGRRGAGAASRGTSARIPSTTTTRTSKSRRPPCCWATRGSRPLHRARS